MPPRTENGIISVCPLISGCYAAEALSPVQKTGKPADCQNGALTSKAPNRSKTVGSEKAILERLQVGWNSTVCSEGGVARAWEELLSESARLH